MKQTEDNKTIDMFDDNPACFYCGGNCPNDEEHACDGYLGDIDGLYSEGNAS
jgi:hypothetical protein